MIHPALSFFGQGEDAPGVLGTRYVVTGHELKTHLDAVNLRFEQTRDEFNSAYGHKKITDQFRHRWASLLASWQDFYVEASDRSYINPLTTAPAVYDEADAYDLERHKIREDLSKLAPEDTPGTDTTVTPPAPPEEATPWYLNLKTVGALVGVGAIAYVAAPPIMAWATKRFFSGGSKAAAEELRLPGRRERIGQAEDARVRLVLVGGGRQVVELADALGHPAIVVTHLLVGPIQCPLQAWSRDGGKAPVAALRLVAHGLVLSRRSAIFASASVVSCTLLPISNSLSPAALASARRAFFSSSTCKRSALFSLHSV